MDRRYRWSIFAVLRPRNIHTFTFELMKPEIKEVIKFIFNKIYNVKLGKDYVKPE